MSDEEETKTRTGTCHHRRKGKGTESVCACVSGRGIESASQPSVHHFYLLRWLRTLRKHSIAHWLRPSAKPLVGVGSKTMSSGGGTVPNSSLTHRARPPTRSVRSSPSSIADKSPSAAPRPTNKQPSLAKRLLFPHLANDVPLPPLLMSPSANPELNDELYDLIAIALRAYVNPWWTKLTRYDKEFLPQVTHVLTAVLRVLEARLVSTDLSPLVFRDLPALLNQHYVDYRNAQAKLHTSYASSGVASLPQLFHQLQSHMAVSPDGLVNEEYIRQAVDNVLKTCLPDEDYDPEPERYIIREIVVKVIAGGVIPRLTQPWFIHKLILDLLGPEKRADKLPEVRCRLICSSPSDHTY